MFVLKKLINRALERCQVNSRIFSLILYHISEQSTTTDGPCVPGGGWSEWTWDLWVGLAIVKASVNEIFFLEEKRDFVRRKKELFSFFMKQNSFLILRAFSYNCWSMCFKLYCMHVFPIKLAITTHCSTVLPFITV